MLYRLCVGDQHFFREDMFIPTKFVYTFCYYQQENPVKYVVDQHTAYTVSVTTNIFSGKICLYQQSLYIPIC